MFSHDMHLSVVVVTEIVIISIDLINSLNSIYVTADILTRMKMKVSHVL